MPAGTPPSFWQRLVALLTAGLRRAYRVLLLFLEVIGLRRPTTAVDRELELARLRLVHTEFRKLLSANDSFLATMAELDQKLNEGGAIDRPYLHRRVVGASVEIFRMISSLDRIAEDERYTALNGVFDGLTRRIEALFAAPQAASEDQAPAVIELAELTVERTLEAGGKLATLGELRGVLRLPVPDGFVVTASAYRRLLRERDAERIRSELMTVFAGDDIPRVSAAVRLLLLHGELPEWLSRDILLAFDRLSARLGAPPLVAVRSSSLEEDSDRSFAGQFLTRLGVDRDGLLAAYREELASLYSPEAMHYRRLAGLTGEAAAMAVGVVAMIDAAASGIVYSRDPRDPESDEVLIQAVHGLGLLLADGCTSPEGLSVRRGGGPGALIPSSLRRSPGRQEVQAVLARGAPVERALTSEERGRTCLRDEDALALAALALQLESTLGGAQDIEWAIDREGRLHLLQSRPLVVVTTDRGGAPVPGATVLLRGGETACAGVASGPAVHVDEDSPPESFPAGGVLVAPRSSPRFVQMMDRARAIVTDAGSATAHMASIARELRIPALLSTGTATRDLPPGATVTVDAGAGLVYAGVVQPHSRASAAVPSVAAGQRRPARASASDRALLQELAALIIPLNLTDPRSRQFCPEGCQTFHDLARFAHEKSYEEMFGLGQRLGDARSFSYALDIFLPLDLYLIDLGGGLKVKVGARKVKPAQVTSVPLAALLRGITHQKIPRFGPRPLDARGLLSVMMRHAVTNPEMERTFRDPCYAMISDHYLNFTSRVGYHFGVVDSYCGPDANRNHINLHFRGGGADILRRARRARMMAEILRALGLHAEVNRDAVVARLTHASLEETSKQLDMIGRLLQFVRQMDVAMVSDRSVAQFRDAFLRGDYGLTGEGITDEAEAAGRAPPDRARPE